MYMGHSVRCISANKLCGVRCTLRGLTLICGVSCTLCGYIWFVNSTHISRYNKKRYSDVLAVGKTVGPATAWCGIYTPSA